jgi:TldD protein
MSMLPFGDDILLNDLLKNHISGIPEHAELRAQINTNRGVSIVSGNLVSNIRSESSGVSARVYKNGVWALQQRANIRTRL